MAIPRGPLRSLVEDSRFRRLDRLESYYRGQQDARKRYDWDGNIMGYGAQVYNSPGWYVPYNQRRPNSRYDLARVIVNRLTSMTFGKDRFPDVKIPGDEEAEDYARALVTESRLRVRMTEARGMGGSSGTACLSFGFVRGRPRIRIHNPKHITVLDWDDDEDYVCREVLKAYSYQEIEWDDTTKKMVSKTYWSCTYWNERVTKRWQRIPDEIAKRPDWMTASESLTSTTLHNYGFCPFYWIQNKPDSGTIDGEGDFEGLETTFDEMNQLLSATTKGTKSNVDPTLVIKDNPNNNNGNVKKGSRNAIYCEKGAEYLELKGTAVQASVEQLERLRGYCLDVAGVVVADSEKLSGAAQSARALEILYAPMLANCDTLREQYGDYGIIPIVRDMLRVARSYQDMDPVEDENGNLVQSRVILPPRMERQGEGDNATQVEVERTPGESENIVLNWRPYFPPTWADIGSAAESMAKASGGKPTVSQRTAVEQMSTLVGVEDVDEELERIEEEKQQAIAEQQEMMAAEQSMSGLFDDDEPPKGKKDKGKDKDDGKK